jgi:hypothetical protein
MPGLSGKVARAGIVALTIAVCVSLLAFGALAGGAKKQREMPRGPYPSLGKCSVFPKAKVKPGAPSLPNESAWRQDISQAPVHPNSDGYLSYIAENGGDELIPYFGSERRQGFPYAVVGKRQKRFRVNWVGHDVWRGPKAPIPAGALIELAQDDDGDRHVITVDRSRCKLFELYRGFFKTDGGRPHWESEGGKVWDLRRRAPDPGGQGSADAAGLPMFAGLVRFDEVKRGVIRHAFRVSLTGTQKAHVLPALHCASEITDPNAPPMGLRLRLKGGYDISGFGGQARVIAVALKHYGLIVADNGENWFFSGTSDQRWNNDDLGQLTQIPGSAFEVVQSAAPAQPC